MIKTGDWDERRDTGLEDIGGGFSVEVSADHGFWGTDAVPAGVARGGQAAAEKPATLKHRPRDNTAAVVQAAASVVYRGSNKKEGRLERRGGRRRPWRRDRVTPPRRFAGLKRIIEPARRMWWQQPAALSARKRKLCESAAARIARHEGRPEVFPDMAPARRTGR